MSVVSLVKYKNRDAIELLESLLVLANHDEARDFMIAFRAPDGSTRVGLTGVYSVDSEAALKATMQVSVHLTRQEEKVRGKP